MNSRRAPSSWWTEYGSVAPAIQRSEPPHPFSTTARPRRLRKLDRTKPIDTAVALALAVQVRTLETAGNVYDERGLIAV
jgi:hypothetical protein